MAMLMHNHESALLKNGHETFSVQYRKNTDKQIKRNF